jgi:DNA-binding transcriptional LysR family regulator
LIDGESSAITSTVRNHEVEFAITSVVDDRKDLKVELVATDPFVLVCGINHPIAGKQKVRWGDLASEKLLGFKSHVSTRQLVDSALRGAGIELSWFYELGQLSSLVGYLSSGEFIAPVPKLLAGFVPGLVSIPLVKPHVERKIYLVRRDGQLSVPAQALWDIIRASFKA